MLACFGLPPDDAAALLRASGGLAAGGAMLHAFLGLPAADHRGALDFFVKQVRQEACRLLRGWGLVGRRLPCCALAAPLTHPPALQ